MSAGHVRSQQRATPSTPRSCKGSQVATPLGIGCHLPLATPAPLPTGFCARGDGGFAAQPGQPVQPMSSRWPVSDSRFDSAPHSPRRTKATPRPNFFTLEEDHKAWRACKAFTFPPPGGRNVLSPRARLALSSLANMPLGSHLSDPSYHLHNTRETSRRPLTSCNDRLIPERPSWWRGVPRATVTPATTLRELDVYRPPRPTNAARLHAGILRSELAESG